MASRATLLLNTCIWGFTDLGLGISGPLGPIAPTRVGQSTPEKENGEAILSENEKGRVIGKEKENEREKVVASVRCHELSGLIKKKSHFFQNCPPNFPKICKWPHGKMTFLPI